MFIVGLMITLFSVYRMSDLVDAKSEVTMVKTNAQGEREIIVKKGTKITAYKVTGKTMAGDGERLGTAYRLANGQIIYVPEGEPMPARRRREHASERAPARVRARSRRSARQRRSRCASPSCFPTATSPAPSKAYKALLEERPDLRGQVTLTFLTESVFDDAKPADVTGADVLVLDIMNQQMLDRFNADAPRRR